MRVRPLDLKWNDNPKLRPFDGMIQPGDTVIYQGKEMRVWALTPRAYILREFEDIPHEPFNRRVNIWIQ